MNIAIDTNLVVSSTFKIDSTPAKLMAAWRMRHFEWVTCKEQLDELEDALFRPRVAARSIGGLPLTRMLFQAIESDCKIVVLAKPLPNVCRDIDDDFLFALHDQGHIDLIVSGDNDVLALKPPYPVLTARELIDRL